MSVERVAALPLFPLQSVLFPGGQLALKIFEARYLDLISDCLRSRQPFGSSISIVPLSGRPELAGCNATGTSLAAADRSPPSADDPS